MDKFCKSLHGKFVVVLTKNSASEYGSVSLVIGKCRAMMAYRSENDIAIKRLKNKRGCPSGVNMSDAILLIQFLLVHHNLLYLFSLISCIFLIKSYQF